MLLHCPAVILNTGWIEATNGNFSIYREGISDSVGKVIEAMDEERLKIAGKYNLDCRPILEIWQKDYGVIGNTVKEAASASVHSTVKKDAPPSLKARYITEDVPYLLVPLVCFARKANVPTPIIDSIISLSSAINGTDYMKEGRNLARMGLADFSQTEIINYVNDCSMCLA